MERNNLNFGYIAAGISGFLLGLYEYNNDSSLNDADNLKKTILQPNDFSPANDEKLIYVTGSLTNNDDNKLKDEIFNISVTGLRLKRNVEMLQWTQEKDLSMKQKWVDHHVDSSKFPKNFENPEWKMHSLDIRLNGSLKVADYYEISSNIIGSINTWKSIQGEYMGHGFKAAKASDKLILHKKIKEFSFPKLGNYRISHDYIPSGLTVSVIGEQQGQKIVPYKGKILIVREGVVKPNYMLDAYASSQNFFLWLIRIACFSVICLGVKLGSIKTPQ